MSSAVGTSFSWKVEVADLVNGLRFIHGDGGFADVCNLDWCTRCLARNTSCHWIPTTTCERIFVVLTGNYYSVILCIYAHHYTLHTSYYTMVYISDMSRLVAHIGRCGWSCVVRMVVRVLPTMVPTSGESRLASATSPNFSFVFVVVRCALMMASSLPASLLVLLNQSIHTLFYPTLLLTYRYSASLHSYLLPPLLKCWWILSLVACFHLPSWWYLHYCITVA